MDFQGVINENTSVPASDIAIGDATHTGTVKLSNAATAYGGSTTINNGATLEVTKLASGGSNSSIGNSAGAATNLIINGGVLKYTGTGDSTNRLFTFDANGATIDASASANGALTFTGTGSLVASGTGNRTLTLTGTSTGANSLASVIANPGTGTTSLTKSGAGAWKLTGANPFTGATTVSSGTLEAAAASALGGTSDITVNTGGTLLLSNTGTTDRINNAATVTMAGGTIAFTGNITEGSSPGTGALTLTANSIIDFGGGNDIINFGASQLATWTSGTTLSIWNWSGSVSGGGNDQLKFGTDSTALTSNQLEQISFYSGAGAGFLGTGGFVGSLGEVVPVPEPSAVFAGLALLGLADWRERRRMGPAEPAPQVHDTSKTSPARRG